MYNQEWVGMSALTDQKICISTKISSKRIGELPWHISSRHCGWDVNMEIVVSISTSTDFMCSLSLDAV